MDLASATNRAKSRKCYHQRIQNETEEERQERLASKRQYWKEYIKNLKPEEKEKKEKSVFYCLKINTTLFAFLEKF